jgi:hypothetical protein
MKTRKLRLHRETLRQIDGPNLRFVAGATGGLSCLCTTVCTVIGPKCNTGGGGSTPYTCDPCSNYCTSGGLACTVGC